MLQVREIKSSRLKSVAHLAISFAFVAVATWLIKDGVDEARRNWIWSSLVFFGLCSIVFIWMLIRPQRLLLDPEGFTLLGGFVRSPEKVAWKDVGEFFAYRLPRGGTMVGFNFQPGARPDSASLKLNRRFGAEAALPKGWAMSPEEMVEELNTYRAQSLSRPT